MSCLSCPSAPRFPFTALHQTLTCSRLVNSASSRVPSPLLSAMGSSRSHISRSKSCSVEASPAEPTHTQHVRSRPTRLPKFMQALKYSPAELSSSCCMSWKLTNATTRPMPYADTQAMHPQGSQPCCIAFSAREHSRNTILFSLRAFHKAGQPLIRKATSSHPYYMKSCPAVDLRKANTTPSHLRCGCVPAPWTSPQEPPGPPTPPPARQCPGRAQSS